MYINKLTEREPSRRTVTVKFGYNAEHLKKQNVAVFTSVDEYFGIGITQNKTAFGNYVPVYDMERSICDIIRNKEKTDIQVFSYALKEYARHKDKNLNNLISYAKLFGIEEEVRSYIEVLL